MDNKIIIFDLDGTLIDTNILIKKSFIHTFKTHSPMYKLTEEELLSFIGPTLEETFSKYFDDNKIEKVIETYRKYNIKQHNDYVDIFPYVKETLSSLYSDGYKLAIFTSKRRDVALMGLNLFDLEKYFCNITCVNDVVQPKPSPEGIFKILKDTNTTSGIMIGDNGTDILSGNDANIETVVVSWS